MIIKAIEDYLAAAQRALDLLSKTLGEDDLIDALRHKRVKRSMELKGISYSFHGIGVWIETDEYEIDIDFLPTCLVGGFDEWRIGLYIENFPKRYPELASKQVIQAAMDHLLVEGWIVKAEQSNLYVLAPHGPVPKDARGVGYS